MRKYNISFIKHILCFLLINIFKNSIIKINEKNKYGEVFTPQSQIDIMLDTLPKHIWNNPNLKWLDPCAGM